MVGLFDSALDAGLYAVIDSVLFRVKGYVVTRSRPYRRGGAARGYAGMGELLRSRYILCRDAVPTLPARRSREGARCEAEVEGRGRLGQHAVLPLETERARPYGRAQVYEAIREA